MARKLSRKGLIAKADQIFSNYIRLNESVNGMCECCTCGRFFTWNDTEHLNAGHYVRRELFNTRWLEPNVHSQCAYDNKWLSGKMPEYTLFLEKKYGKGIVSELVQEGNRVRTWKDYDILEVLEMYCDKLEALAQEKGVILSESVRKIIKQYSYKQKV